VRIAVLADIHGNLPALEAVLAELDGESCDALVVAGDLVPGPFPAECLAALRARPEPIHWVKGNGEREVVAAIDGDDAPESAHHSAAALSRADRDGLDGWPIALALDGVCFCHGSPRTEDEVITRATPEPVLREMLAEVHERLVIGGHTHQQMVRAMLGSGSPCADYANAGSVGRPYEGEPAAFWMVVQDGEPELRRTAYDVDAAVARIRASGDPGADDALEGSITDLASPEWVTAFFEHGAGRGDDPGPPVAAA
jgi:predicted phosphodiesterase